MSDAGYWPDWINDPQLCYREHYRIEKRVAVILPYHGMNDAHLPYLDAWTRAMIVMGVWTDIAPQNKPWTLDDLKAGRQHAPIVAKEIRLDYGELLDKWNVEFDAHLIPQWLARGSRGIASGLNDLCRTLRYLHEFGTESQRPAELYKPQFTFE